jgi:hypothetical protein
VVTSNQHDWLNGSSTPSWFKAVLIWTGITSVSVLREIQRILIFIENKHPSRATLLVLLHVPGSILHLTGTFKLAALH